MHNKTRKNCIKLIKTIEKCKKVVYYEAINKEETGRGTTNNKGGGIVDRRDHDRCQELYVKYRQFMYWYVKKHFPDLPEEDIRDILQEVWTSLLNAIDKLYDKGDEGQFAWLIRVTQTKVIDYYRSRRRTGRKDRSCFTGTTGSRFCAGHSDRKNDCNGTGRRTDRGRAESPFHRIFLGYER